MTPGSPFASENEKLVERLGQDEIAWYLLRQRDNIPPWEPVPISLEMSRAAVLARMLPSVDAPMTPKEMIAMMKDGTPLIEKSTPPDFDAAVEGMVDLVYEWMYNLDNFPRDKNGVFCALADRPEYTAARQRVRELYEAVVRERDDWQHRAIGTEAKLVVAHLGLDALRAAQGEEYEVTNMHSQMGIRTRVIKVPPQEFSPGDRVRVTKVGDV